MYTRFYIDWYISMCHWPHGKGPFLTVKTLRIFLPRTKLRISSIQICVTSCWQKRTDKIAYPCSEEWPRNNQPGKTAYLMQIYEIGSFTRRFQACLVGKFAEKRFWPVFFNGVYLFILGLFQNMALIIIILILFSKLCALSYSSSSTSFIMWTNTLCNRAWIQCSLYYCIAGVSLSSLLLL